MSMEKAPTVSVIIPTYKRPRECVRAVKSVLLQSFKGFEIIVGDDYGKDETELLLKELKDPRIRYFDNEGQGGSASKNRNLCVANSRGEFLTFLDSDDLMLPDRLEKQVAALEGHGVEVGFVIAGTRVVRVLKGKCSFSHDLVPTAEGDLREAYFARRLRCYNTSLMVRRDVLTEIGEWDHRMEPYDDAELMFRLLSHTKAARVEDILTIWFDHDGESLTNDLSKRMSGLEAFMLKHETVLEQQVGWWKSRVEELLKWCFLGPNLECFHKWQPRLNDPVPMRIRFIQFCARVELLFRLVSWLFGAMQQARSMMKPSARAQMLANLIPQRHREVISAILYSSHGK